MLGGPNTNQAKHEEHQEVVVVTSGVASGTTAVTIEGCCGRGGTAELAAGGNECLDLRREVDNHDVSTFR